MIISSWLTTVSNRIRNASARRRLGRKFKGNRFTQQASPNVMQAPAAFGRLSSSIRKAVWQTFDVAPRFTRDSRRFQPQAWNTSDISEMTERLEDRTLLSAFNEAVATLNIDINSASENVAISSNGATYTLVSSGTFSGTDTSNVTGTGTNTLTVTAAGLTNFNLINVTDSSTAASFTFNDSAANTYGDSISVTLDDATAGTITFNGASSFTGTAALSASTARNIVVSSGSSVTTVNGGITLDANSAGAQTADFRGLEANNATIQTTGTGNISLAGKGAENGDDTSAMYGVYLHSGTSVSSTASGSSAGTITINGTGGDGTSFNRGVYLFGSSTDVTSVDGAISITGNGGDGTGERNHGVYVSILKRSRRAVWERMRRRSRSTARAETGRRITSACFSLAAART